MTTPSWIGEMDLQSNDKYPTRRKAQMYLGQKRRYLEDRAERDSSKARKCQQLKLERKEEQAIPWSLWQWCSHAKTDFRLLTPCVARVRTGWH